MPFAEIAALVVCSTCAGFYIGRNPRLPEFMTPEADRPVRARVSTRRRAPWWKKKFEERSH